ncbi:MAG: bifunctional glycosyltransferase family 2/GtrA family protein [Ilumatobacteraceae bacterium]
MDLVEQSGGAAERSGASTMPLHQDLPGGDPHGCESAIVVDVTVPVYNEAHVLRQSIERLHAYLSAEFPFTWQITIADNASTDATLEVAELLAVELTNLRVLHLDSKGRGRALRAAWTSSTATVVAYMDVDLSTGLDALLPLVAPLLSGHSDLAIGSRLAPGAAVARGPQREFISRSYNGILRAVFLNRFRDAQCGFKAARADIARSLLPAVEDNGWFFDTEILLLAEHNGLRVFEVPVDWIDDPDTRVHIRRTASADLRGVARLARTFARGKGRVDLGKLGRTALPDDMGRQLVGFVFVGLLSTAASLAMFLLLRHRVGAIPANLIALTATTLANSWANRRYTFGQRGRSDRNRQFVRATLVWALGALISSLALGLVVVADGSYAVEITVLLAAWSLMAFIRFALLRAFVFRHRPEPRSALRSTPITAVR